MSVQIVVFNALGSLDANIERDVRAGIEDGVAAFSSHAKVDRIGISVYLHGYVSAYTGLGGMTYGPESISLFVDDSHEGLREDTRRPTAAVTVHELHHALRQRRQPPLRRLSGVPYALLAESTAVDHRATGYPIDRRRVLLCKAAAATGHLADRAGYGADEVVAGRTLAGDLRWRQWALARVQL